MGESSLRDTEVCCAVPSSFLASTLLLWLIKADDRALAVDEHFYHQVIGEAYRHKVLFVISQSDKAEPTSGGDRCPPRRSRISAAKSACCMSCSSPYIRCVLCRSVYNGGLRVMAERMIKCLPREATSPVVSQLQPSFRTTVVREQARSDFGETVGALLDSISAFPLIPTPVRAVIQAVRTTVVSVARAIWDFFF